MTYAEKLKDPRWQRKRLEIFDRDGFKCIRCGDGLKTLHVHHLQYYGEPWEAPDAMLSTLCCDCHAGDHARVDAERLLISELSRCGFSAIDVYALASSVMWVHAEVGIHGLVPVLAAVMSKPGVYRAAVEAMES